MLRGSWAPAWQGSAPKGAAGALLGCVVAVARPLPPHGRQGWRKCSTVCALAQGGFIGERIVRCNTIVVASPALTVPCVCMCAPRPACREWGQSCVWFFVSEGGVYVVGLVCLNHSSQESGILAGRWSNMACVRDVCTAQGSKRLAVAISSDCATFTTSRRLVFTTASPASAPQRNLISHTRCLRASGSNAPTLIAHRSLPRTCTATKGVARLSVTAGVLRQQTPAATMPRCRRALCPLRAGCCRMRPLLCLECTALCAGTGPRRTCVHAGTPVTRGDRQQQQHNRRVRVRRIGITPSRHQQACPSASSDPTFSR